MTSVDETAEVPEAAPAVPGKPEAPEQETAEHDPALDVAAVPDGEPEPEPGDEPESDDAREERQAAEADKMTAEAMAAPLAAPMTRAQLDELGYEHVLAHVWAAYRDCRAPSETDCRRMADQWEAQARAAIFGPLDEELARRRSHAAAISSAVAARDAAA